MGDSRALVGLVQGRAVRRVLRKVRAVLADPSVPLGVREKLQSDAAEFLRLGAAAEEQRRARRKKTLAHRQKTTAELSAKERRKRLLDAMLALRQGEDVPKEVLAEASRTYEEILGQERRDRDR